MALASDSDDSDDVDSATLLYASESDDSDNDLGSWRGVVGPRSMKHLLSARDLPLEQATVRRHCRMCEVACFVLCMGGLRPRLLRSCLAWLTCLVCDYVGRRRQRSRALAGAAIPTPRDDGGDADVPGGGA
mgnify:CR=1 FL=1